MKKFWIEIDQNISDNERGNLLKLATQVCDAVLEKGLIKDIKATNLVSPSSSSKLGMPVLEGFDEAEISKLKEKGKKVAIRIYIKGKKDEDDAVKAADLSVDFIILDCIDWKIIPLENLIARTRGKTKLIAEVSNVQEARLALATLELGTDGVLLKTSDPDELMKTTALIRGQTPNIELLPAEIVSIKQISSGARVCVDTCDLMKAGEGMLVGCQSAGLFLVEAEVHENPYVQSRPFRVNAGSLSQYTLTSLKNTRYLSELKAGEEVLVVDRNGILRLANVGRVKIEFRPLLLIEAEVENMRVKAILQNAETIRVVTPDGSKPVTELETGDQVLVCIAAKGGRHFGISVPNETVIER
ncbi:3-dehydroquinate synthase II [Candidatus Bathyarchaeota archaeon]|nr:3-dehydroquinate synthase II [Candidatus Bathyarchaeota archaeon]